jgi:hypothetical protein
MTERMTNICHITKEALCCLISASPNDSAKQAKTGQQDGADGEFEIVARGQFHGFPLRFR